jgi:hypothetical protein
LEEERRREAEEHKHEVGVLKSFPCVLF